MNEEDAQQMTDAEFKGYHAEIKYNLLKKFASALPLREWAKDLFKVLETHADVAVWDTGAETDMSELFNDAKDFDEDISRWDTSNVENMSEMFKGATSFNKEYIKSWSGRGWNKNLTNEELKQAAKDWAADSILRKHFTATSLAGIPAR